MPIPDLVCVFVHKSENYLFSFHCRVIREQRLFHLRGHTQNSGLVNLIPESLLPLVPISTFPLTEKWPRRPEIGIKDDCFKEMEQEYMYSIRKKKTGLSFQMFSCSVRFICRHCTTGTKWKHQNRPKVLYTRKHNHATKMVLMGLRKLISERWTLVEPEFLL